MKKKHLNIILAIISFWSYGAYSQIPCTVPLPPILTSVSVQPETGITELKWTLSPSSDVASYIPYTYKDGDGMPFDTIKNPLETSYVYSSTASKYFSVSYVIAAHRMPNCTSPFSNIISTIFAEASIDTCNKKIVVSWNSYTSYPKKVTGYSILVSVDGVNLPDTAKASFEKNSFTIPYFGTAAKYCFVVRANLEDGTSSTSNKACSSPGVCTVPPVIIIDTTDIITEPTEIITVPNVLISNSVKGNNLFIPWLSFTPKYYHLIISDRRGNILFERKVYDKSDAWDGSGKGNGVYLWFLKVTTPTGKSISKTGTVTIINNRE